MKKLLIAAMLIATPAAAETNITISKSHQMMQVDSDYGSYQWRVSTARKGYYTPTGTFHPVSYTHLTLPTILFTTHALFKEI